MSAPLSWTEVRVLVPQGWQELVAEALSSDVASAAFGRSSLAADPAPEGFDFVRLFLAAPEDTAEKRADLQAKAAALPELTGAEELRQIQIEFRDVPHEDWATSWRKSWKPFRVGRLAVIPKWSPLQPRESDLRLTLEPGGAFGSGRHPTTRTCLKLLQERETEGTRVLDAGSGSGILSVAAALLGAKSALGFDTDTYAKVYADDLAADNGTTDRTQFRTGGFECLGAEDTAYDVVVANIYSDVIQAHAKDLAERLRPGGWFAFSGCPMHHEEPTREAIEAAPGIALEEIRRRGRWVTFTGVLEG